MSVESCRAGAVFMDEPKPCQFVGRWVLYTTNWDDIHHANKSRHFHGQNIPKPWKGPLYNCMAPINTTSSESAAWLANPLPM